MSSLRAKLVSKVLPGLSDDQIAAVMMNTVSQRPQLEQALIVRMANSLPVANDNKQGKGTPMLGMQVVDSLKNADPSKPLGVTISNYREILGGASTAVIAEKDGIPYVLLGDAENREKLVVPQGFFNPNPALSPQGLYNVHDSEQFQKYEKAQENGTPLLTTPINHLTRTPPQGDKDKRANAVRELEEETGIKFPPEKLLFVDATMENGIRKTKTLPDQPYQQDVSFFVADMRGTNSLPHAEARDDLPSALWVPVPEIIKTQNASGEPEYSYKGKPVDTRIGQMIEKGMAMLRAQDFEKIGITKDRILKYAAARAKAMGTENPLDPVPGEFDKAAIAWHSKALEIAKEMDKTLTNISSQDKGRSVV